MNGSQSGRIYDIQGFSVHDGPGIRTTVFLKGCPLHCPWCHSPESQRYERQLRWRSMKCVGIDACGLCLDVCMADCINAETSDDPQECGRISIDWARCVDCGACIASCPSGALSYCGNDLSVDRVMARIVKEKIFFDASEGGVTISGGEPLCQVAFCRELLAACKEEGIGTAVDTTGFVSAETLKAVLPLTDLFLYDIKHMDTEAHERVIGVPNTRILDNARYIAHLGGSLRVRIPLIPHFNDSEGNIRKTALFLKELGGAVESVQLLPYHSLGLAKYQQIKHPSKLFEADVPPDDAVGHLALLFEEEGIKATIH